MTPPPDAADRLRLIRSERIGPVTYRQLVRRFGSAAVALRALPDLARRAGGEPPRLADPAAIDRELAAAARLGVAWLFLDTPDYPPLLAATETAPPALGTLGDAGLVERPCVAIVGARNASAAATRFARQLAAELADVGVVVVSGLARGVDAAAHWGALGGGTVGVIAGGLDIAYPPENAALQQRIAAEGLLVAEQPLGTEPQARHFPRRNRVIAGLCAGTVVVEGALKSGSLITARLAAEMGREVMAIPGSPLDPRAQGCNQLIREGATLVQSAADILEALDLDRATARVATPPATEWSAMSEIGDDDRAAVAGLLSPTPVGVDELVRQSGVDGAAVAAALLDLELAGRLARHAGGRVALV